MLNDTFIHSSRDLFLAKSDMLKNFSSVLLATHLNIPLSVFCLILTCIMGNVILIINSYISFPSKFNCDLVFELIR